MSAAHADAVATLTHWVAPDAGQERLRASYLQVLADNPDAVRRDGPPAHLTVGCLVIDPSGEHVLLTHHRKADAWYQFGGHIDDGDPGLRAAALRELAEESGLADLTPTAQPVHLDRHALPGGFGRCAEHLDVRYAALAPRSATPQVSEESLDVRWWAVRDLPPAAAADLGGLIAAARIALGCPCDESAST